MQPTPRQIVVQKYGGSSVSDPVKLGRVADRVAEAVRSGRRVVVVVSAMGKTTDELLQLARLVTPEPPRRELDMLLSTGEQNLDPGFAEDWRQASDDAERKRAVVDQVASLTDQSAIAWFERLRHAPHAAD